MQEREGLPAQSGTATASAAMNVLVTGGAGYLGTVLSLLLLRAGHEVRVLDNLMHGGKSLLAMAAQEGFDFVHGDLLAGGTIQNAVRNVESVVHLAAIVGDPACAKRPDLAKAVNQQASLDMLAAAQAGAGEAVGGIDTIRGINTSASRSGGGGFGETTAAISHSRRARPRRGCSR